MKIVLVKFLSTLSIMAFAFLSLHSYANTIEKKTDLSLSNGIRVCPGSGSSCILWGLVYKGSDNSHAEPIRDEESQPQPTSSNNQ